MLGASFDIGELKFYPGAKTKDGTKARVFTYIDARAVMDRLDAVVTPAGWQTSYRVLDLAVCAVECQLTVSLAEGMVTKSDVGYPNDPGDAKDPGKEPLKAAFSDALKRAAVQFGIGRYIYGLELEQDYLPIDEWGKFKVAPRIKGAKVQPTYAPSEPEAPRQPPAPPQDYGPVTDVGKPPPPAGAGADVTCKLCNGACYDNTGPGQKRTPTAPDYRCKKCGAAAWIGEDRSLTWKAK